MAAASDSRRRTVAGRIAGFLLYCLSAVLVPALLILCIAVAGWFGVRPLYWWLWSGRLPHNATYALTGLAAVLLPLALFWLLVGVPRLAVRIARQARRR